jgi:hypothetical protein
MVKFNYIYLNFIISEIHLKINNVVELPYL